MVARVGDGEITAAELEAKLNEQPAYVRTRYQTPAAKQEFLDNLVRFELLMQEAKRQKLDADPEVRATLEKLMVQKLIQRNAAKTAENEPSEEELRQYYQAHLSEFSRPERVRISHVFFASAASDPRRPQVQAEAVKALSEVRKQEAGPLKNAFSELAKQRSDDAATKPLAGDLGFKTKEELVQQWGAELSEAAFAIANQGDMVQVTSARGVHLLKLTGRQPGMDRSFESVKAVLESRVKLEQRAQAMDRLVAELRAKTTIHVDGKALEAVKVSGETASAAASKP